MPPKVKITKEDIIKTALNILRSSGKDALNARNIAITLNCSTQPIFSNFATMEDLLDASVKAAYELYLGFLQAEAERGEYPEYKAFGMAYIKFARDEKQLFKLLFMCDRGGEALQPSADFEASVRIIMDKNGISRAKAEIMHMEMWTCVHGIGTMLATSFLDLDLQLISDMLTDVYQGIRSRHLSGGIQNECN